LTSRIIIADERQNICFAISKIIRHWNLQLILAEDKDVVQVNLEINRGLIGLIAYRDGLLRESDFPDFQGLFLQYDSTLGAEDIIRLVANSLS